MSGEDSNAHELPISPTSHGHYFPRVWKTLGKQHRPFSTVSSGLMHTMAFSLPQQRCLSPRALSHVTPHRLPWQNWHHSCSSYGTRLTHLHLPRALIQHPRGVTGLLTASTLAPRASQPRASNQAEEVPFTTPPLHHGCACFPFDSKKHIHAIFSSWFSRNKCQNWKGMVGNVIPEVFTQTLSIISFTKKNTLENTPLRKTFLVFGTSGTFSIFLGRDLHRGGCPTSHLQLMQTKTVKKAGEVAAHSGARELPALQSHRGSLPAGRAARGHWAWGKPATRKLWGRWDVKAASV